MTLASANDTNPDGKAADIAPTGTPIGGTLDERTESGPRPMALEARAAVILERYGLVLLFLLLVVFFSLWAETSDTFPTAANARTIIGNQSVMAILAVGAIIPLIGGHLDLSVSATLALSSIATAAALSRFQAPLWVAVGVGIGIGALVGLINGTLVAKLGVNALITTLGTATILGGLILWYTDGLSIITGIPQSLTDMGSGRWIGLPRPLFVLLAVAVAVWFLLANTPYGRYLTAVGANPQAARLVGLRVDRVVLVSFVLSGAVAGAAGVLQVARAGGGNPQISQSFLLPALAAAFLGATTIRPGRYNVPGTILAVFFLAVGVSGLAQAGVANWVEPVFNGSALVLAVVVSTTFARRRAR